jgi:hypothetical protein
MTQAIEPFNPQSYAEKLRDKIKSALVDIVPDEQWERLIKAEIETFFRSTTRDTRSYQWTETVPSDFQSVTRRILTEEACKRVKEMLNEPEWTSVWADGRVLAGQKITDILVANAGPILAAWVGQSFQMAVDQFKNQR